MSKIEKIMDNLYKKAKILEINSNSKIVLMSDLHRGTGNQNDNYLHNSTVVNYALKYYNKNSYTYIELGDGDELWENRSLNEIINIHRESFMLLKEFYDDNRLISIYGNHDIVKKSSKFLKKNYYKYYDNRYLKDIDLFPNIKVEESVLLKDSCGVEFLLFHGHQGDFINDFAWKLGRFLVRYLWKPLEMWSLKDPTKASKNNSKISKLEKEFKNWSKETSVVTIAGHTHRAVFPTAKKDFEIYYNDGCGVSPNGITAIEIENGEIKLVEWKTNVENNGNVIIAQEILEESRLKINKLTCKMKVE